MDELQRIKQALRGNPNVVIEGIETSRLLPRHSDPSSYHLSVHISVCPKRPIPDIDELQEFMEKEVQKSIPLKPFNICKSYQYTSMGKKFNKLGALYYYEAASLNEGRWIAISIHPCQEMAKGKRIREVIELWSYNCSEPCKISAKCPYKMKKPKMFG